MQDYYCQATVIQKILELVSFPAELWITDDVILRQGPGTYLTTLLRGQLIFKWNQNRQPYLNLCYDK